MECQICARLQNKHSEATNQLLNWEAKRQLAAVVPSAETEETINRRLREVSATCVSLREELLAHMKAAHNAERDLAAGEEALARSRKRP